MDLQNQVLNILDFKDVVSLEIVQHEKVKLIFESSPVAGTIRAELFAPGCENGQPCSQLSHSIIHTGTQSFLSISVRPEETDYRQICVAGLFALVVIILLCIWAFRKWVKIKQNATEPNPEEDDCEDSKQSLEDLTTNPGPNIPTNPGQDIPTHPGPDLHTNTGPDLPTDQGTNLTTNPGLMNGHRKCDNQHCSDSRTDIQPAMTTRQQSCVTRSPSRCIYATVLTSTAIIAMIIMLGSSHTHNNVDLAILRVSIPQSTNVRHIRSFSEDPSIKDVQIGQGAESSLVTRLQLLDLSPNCRNNLTECRIHALCDTGSPQGNVQCRCNRGFYLQDLTCTPCKTSCNDGHYMTQQCSAESDVVCKPCTQCEGTSYQVATCTSTQDTLCIDVTFPLRQYQSRVTSLEELVSMNVSMSKNVFLERLHNIKKLETPLYMSNNRQEMQFVWRRPSGLEIKVKVSDIYLIPEYVDIDHVDDIRFISEYKGFPQDTQDQLQNVINQHCRHPLPDEYDLILHLERNVTTTATEITCDSKSRSLPPCPDGYSDGDTYIDEHLSTPCSKAPDANSMLFRHRSNNILCSGNTALLKSVFRMNAEKMSYLTFPSEECKKYQEDCNRCLSQRACTRQVSDTSDCCNRMCHGLSHCQNLYSNTCPVAPIECARGDVSKFSIMPRYPSIQYQFSCHLRHLPPQHLYLLSYEASIPSMQFTFGERSKEVKFKNLTDSQDGTDQVDYLSMNHHTESKYSDEVILSGTFDTTRIDNPVKVKDYTLHKLKQSWEFDRSRGYEINRLKTKVQFEEPFLYSTSNWNKDGCGKNVSKIVPAQSLFHQFGLPVIEPDKKMKNGRFVYQLLSMGSVPHIRFSMPENTSILSYYKADFSSANVNPGSLKGQMVWGMDTHIWTITITGSISSCPGFFTLEIFTENMDTRLAMYDMFITCPQTFSIVFNIRRDSVEFLDKFIAVINDTIASYNIILSSIQGPQYFSSADDNSVAMETGQASPWIPIIVIMTICICVSVFLFAVYLYCDKQKAKLIPTDITLPKPDLGAQITLLQNMDAPKKKEGLSRQTQCIMFTLIVLYVIYALLFTFMALFGVLHVIQGSSLSGVTLVSNTSAKIQSNMQDTLQKMVEYENKETTRLVIATEQRLKACSYHLKSSLHNSVPDLNAEMAKKLTRIFRDNGTVQVMLGRYFTNRREIYQREINNFVDGFNETLDTNLHKIYTTYKSYLKEVAENRWFNFPKDIFLQQQRLLGVTDNLAGFLKWLEIDKVQEIIEIKDILMNRLLLMIPKLDFSKLLNDTDDTEKMAANIHLNFSVAENWFRFTSSPAPGGYYGYHQTSREENTNESGNKIFNIFNQQNKTPNVNINNVSSITGILYPVFISVFLILDFLLLLYRFSWLKRSCQIFKQGVEQRVPYDSITRKVYFILTGRDVPRLKDSMDHPYDYYINNKEDFWGGNTELYFLYCQGNAKSKEEILKDIWSHKQQQKTKTETDGKKSKSVEYYCVKMCKLSYRLLISPAFWRIVIICGFVLFVCLVTKATDDLVTMESAVFLLDTEAMLPILVRQNDITNTVISQYADYLNNFISQYKQVLDGEVQTLNIMLVQVAQRQSVLLNTLISDMCNLAGMEEECDLGVNLVTMSLTSCNFLPLQTQPYSGFHENILSEFIKAELSPVVMNIRRILFSTLYLLLTFAAVMMICQILARVIFVHLQKSRHLRTTKIYQIPSNIQTWEEQQSFPEKDVYDGQSVIAESCESGVYDMTS